MSTNGFEPIQAGSTWPLIERAYRESGLYTWARETTQNAIEAGATQIEFGVEWQAVASQGVYRRIIADNGSGMNDIELRTFFNLFGGGGKAIGGIHENYGVGAKSSLFPWNPLGVIVVSWKDGIPAMIRVHRDGNEYGMWPYEVEDENGVLSLAKVIDPGYEEELGCDLSQLRPDWMKDSDGTVILLLGRSLTEDTVLGDIERGEVAVAGIQKYMNSRFWNFPEGFTVRCVGPQKVDKSTWERKPRATKVVKNLSILGAKNYVDRNSSEQGVVELPDGTKVHWYLAPDGEREVNASYAETKGYSACLYKEEIYDLPSAGPARTSRQRYFGVGHKDVRDRVWLLLEPPHYIVGQSGGVSPISTRMRLEWNAPSTGVVAGELPWYDWGTAFQAQMPEPIAKAVEDAQSNQEPVDEDFKKELDKKFAGRWRSALVRVRGNRPSKKVTPEGIVRPPTGTPGTPTPGGNPDPNRTPVRRPRKRYNPLLKKGTDIKNPQGAFIPDFKWVSDEELFEPGMMASYSPTEGKDGCGTIYLNREHKVIVDEIARYCDPFDERQWEDVEEFVLTQYAQLAVAAVAHSQYVPGMSESIRDPKNPDAIERGVLSPAAITMSMLGIKAQEAVIKPGLGGKFGRRQQAA